MLKNNVNYSFRPAFLVTVDAEGDNLWSRPREISTENARFLPRFQALCEKYALKPTWLVNYEMAECREFVESGRDLVRREAGEIGMHLHAWNSPPIVPLTNDDVRNQPYLYEYPEGVMREKIGFMTDLLEDRFERKMLSHRAGRWGLDAIYARLLVEHGYLVDCSVTPHVSWAEYLGDPLGAGGPDFRLFPELPYFVDLGHADRAFCVPLLACKQCDLPLLEVPLSVIETRWSPNHVKPGASRVRRCTDTCTRLSPRLMQRIFRRFFPPYLEMVPRDRRRSLRDMLAILHHAVDHSWPCVELAIHSSELMPGGSPFFPTAASIERLYDRLEIVFSAAAQSFQGMTLSEFRNSVGDYISLQSPVATT